MEEFRQSKSPLLEFDPLERKFSFATPKPDCRYPCPSDDDDDDDEEDDGDHSDTSLHLGYVYNSN